MLQSAMKTATFKKEERRLLHSFREGKGILTNLEKKREDCYNVEKGKILLCLEWKGENCYIRYIQRVSGKTASYLQKIGSRKTAVQRRRQLYSQRRREDSERKRKKIAKH